MSIDIERLKVDADYWDEVAPVGATHALHLEPEISFYKFRLTNFGHTYELLQKNGDFVKKFDFYRDYPHETDLKLLPKPRKSEAQPSTASPLSNSAPIPDGATHYNIDQKCFLALFDKKNVMYFNPDDGGWWRKLTNGTSNKMFVDVVEIDWISHASLLTDEQAEARMGEPIVIERKAGEVKKSLKASGLVIMKVNPLHDPVNNPSHYASGGIECIDAMQAMLSHEEFIGYLRGNVFKYQWRYKLKNGVEDLKKAQWYQNKLIEVESK